MSRLATITVIGKDKTGVIAAVTSFLFEQKANIEALEEQVTRGQFSMTLQASWQPKDWEPAALDRGLQSMARRLGMEIRMRATEPGQRPKVAIMVTREPHCLLGLLDAFRKGTLHAEPCVIIGNRKELAPAASEANIPFRYISWTQRDSAERRAIACLDEYGADLVVLARFMKILSPTFVWRYKNKIINIHPSLLPSFPGPQAYRQAYEKGVKIAGVTAHFVSMHLDEGPIIAQASFPIHPSMSLKDIVAQGQKLETRVLLRAVRLFLTRHLDVYWGTVHQI